MFRLAARSALATATVTAVASFAGVGTAAAAEVAVEERSGSSSRIVGGYTPHPSQWPWMTSVGWSRAERPGRNAYQRHFCGGALIAPRVVLTAAHCVYDEKRLMTASELGAVLGRRVLSASGGEELDVADVRVHPSYDDDTLQNDVALLRLSRESGQPTAALDPGFRLSEGNRPTVMGWGHAYSGGTTTDDLRAADVPLWSSDNCVAAYSDFGWQHDPSTMLCAGWAEGDNNSCQGDSGGPLMIPDQAGRWRLIGTVSWADNCAQAGRPTNFAWVNAAEIRSWIGSTTTTLSAPDRRPAPQPQPARAPVAESTRSPIRPGQPGAPTTTTADTTSDDVSRGAAVLVWRLRARGTRISFRLSSSATVTIKLAGRRGGRTRTLRTIHRRGRAGDNAMRIERIRGARRVTVSVVGGDGVRSVARTTLGRR